MSKTLEQRVKALEDQVKTLNLERPGRKAKPMLVLRQKGVCAIDPERNSATCPDSSIFRYQNGCHGTACMQEQQNAYQRRKDKKEAEAVAVSVRSRRSSNGRISKAPVATKARKTTAKQ